MKKKDYSEFTQDDLVTYFSEGFSREKAETDDFLLIVFESSLRGKEYAEENVVGDWIAVSPFNIKDAVYFSFL